MLNPGRFIIFRSTYLVARFFCRCCSKAMIDSSAEEQQECQTVDEEPFLFIHGVPIHFREDWRTGIGGGLWSTGLALGRYFGTDAALSNVRNLSQREEGADSLSILELGSGNGFLAVCIAAAISSMGSFRVRDFVVTDELDHLDMIRKIIEANPSAMKCVDNLSIIEHRWGTFPTSSTIETGDAVVLDGTRKFDLIVGSDVAYREYLYDPLIRSIKQFSHSRTVALIGVTMIDTTPEFFHRLDRADLVWQKFADHLLESDFRGTTFGVMAIQQKAKR
jgi:predicted nicotinamide N-methyase